eukprot:CAMPEP_0174909224 /NCGR_PEP_ID=MMETSP0167-20121228/67669_1 /TAXON_ID=38298 /ORGANISM="Rhodella maculata, Strain CCMP736" /LENGTH=49 /DNA_ID=CAMNT_0016153159 /DNA_START=113 /DNA_END=262 /DNA_ORIENTATION=-
MTTPPGSVENQAGDFGLRLESLEHRGTLPVLGCFAKHYHLVAFGASVGG